MPFPRPPSPVLPACGLCVRSPALPLFSFSLCIPHSAPACRQAGSALVTPVPALLYKNSSCGVLVTLLPALTYKNRCPQVSGAPFPVPVPGSPFPVPALLYNHRCPQVSGCPFPVPGSPLLGVIHNGVCQCVHVTNHQIRVKIGQNGDVFRQKGIKKARVSSCPS
jgi:hypothetical protein